MRQTFLLIAMIICFTAIAQPSGERVIVQSERGSCPMILDSKSVNVRDLLNNIENRLKALQIKAAASPELRRELQPTISELSALIAMFPPEVSLVPVDAQIIKAIDEYSFDFFIVKMAEMNDKDRLQYLKTTGTKEFFDMNQIGQLVQLFDSTQSKFEAVRILRANIVDPENAWTIRDKFVSESDGEKCIEIIFSWEE